MTIVKRLLPLFVALAVLAGCGDDDAAPAAANHGDGTTQTTAVEVEAAAFPVTVTADNGEVTIDEKPTAIVSLSPSITEMLYAVGAGDQVTAVDAYSNFPDGLPTTDLSGFRPNVEAIGALEPDLVFLARDSDDVAATLEGVGIPVIVLESPTAVDGVFDQIRTVGSATGHAPTADRLADEVEAGIDELVASVPTREEPLTYFYELTGDYNTVTSETFIGSLLDLVGLVNIADGVDPGAGAYPQLTAEYVLDTDPDLIFLAHSDGSIPTDDELASRPGWNGLTALADGNVVALDPDISSRWGPRVVELLSTVVDAVTTADRG